MTTDADTELWARLGAVFEDVFEQEVELSRETTAADVEGWDSVRNVELLVALEREFGVRFTTGDIATLSDVGGLVDAIRARAG